MIRLLYVPVGTYSFVEVKPLAGYKENDPIPFEVLKENGLHDAASFVVKNDPLSVEVSKINSDTHIPLPGIKFQVTDVDTGEVVSFRKTSLGYLAVRNDVGYPIEPIPPIVVTSYSDVVPTPNRVVGQMTNHLPPTWIFDEERFGVISGSDLTKEPETDEKGFFRLLYLPYGEYRIREMNPLPGHADAIDQQITITYRNGFKAPVKVGFFNDSTHLEIIKKDAIHDNRLSNVAFSITRTATGERMNFIRQGNGMYDFADKGTDRVSEIVTDEIGYLLLRYLPADTYTISEVRPPEGYQAIVPITKTLTKDHSEEKPLSITILNNPTEIIIDKVDAVTEKPLSGVSFILVRETDKINQQPVYRYLNCNVHGYEAKQ